MPKPIESQLVYKKVISFTKQQKESLQTLESYGVNVNQFIRSAVKDKLAKDWKGIKEQKERVKYPF